ncbi:MAG: S41 family peptidase, partial [Chloroflexi bacterium]|nr:S41 family peptidase [Chloroflexota bacterium]
MNKAIRLRTLVTGLLLALVCFVLGYYLSPAIQPAFAPPQSPQFTNDEWQLFDEVNAKIRDEFLDKDVSTSTLMNGVLGGMVGSLGDPYSQYLDPSSYSDWTSEISGTYGGIGMELGAKDDRPTVISVFPDSPAEKAGVRSGDHFVKVDETMVEGITITQIAQKVKGPIGTEVKLLMERGGEILTFTLKRAQITVQSVSGKMLQEGVGMIRLLGFKEQTADDFGRTLEQLSRQGMKKLLLDLRQNPGGLLSSVIDVASYLVPANQTIVILEDRNGNKRVSHSTPLTPKFQLPIVVLIDGGTASAAEILAGALRDHQLATLVGERSFGKGIVQTSFQLSQGSALVL